MQNQVAIVMCNRVGKEGDVTFAGQSVVVDRTATSSARPTTKNS